MNMAESYQVTKTSSGTKNKEKRETVAKEFLESSFIVTPDNGKLLGSGGFATAIKCEHIDLGAVVVKKYHLTGGTKTLNQLRINAKQEVEIMCRLFHKNIVQSYGFLDCWNYFGIVMECINGGNLEDLINSEEKYPVSWGLRVRMLGQLASAISYLHGFGKKKAIIHGDIKPSNVLLTKRLEIKLADFGSAELEKGTGASNISFEVKPTKQYTVFYAAPELLQNSKQLKTKQMDVYSFSMVMHEVIALERVYNGHQCNIGILVQAIIHKPERPEFEIPSLNPPDLEICNILCGIKEECWHGNPVNRPDISKVKLELKQHLKRLIGAELAIAERKLASILFQEHKSTDETAEPQTGASTKLPRAQVVEVKEVPNNDILLKIEMVHGLIDTGDLEKGVTISQELIQALIGVSDEEIETITIAKRLCKLAKKLVDKCQTTLATQLVAHALDICCKLNPDEQLDGLWRCVLVVSKICRWLVDNDMKDAIEPLLPIMEKAYRSMNAIYDHYRSTSQRVDEFLEKKLWVLKRMGQMYYNLCNYELCVSYCKKALSLVNDLSDFTPNVEVMYSIWQHLGLCYIKQELWMKASESLKNALDIYNDQKSCNRDFSEDWWTIPLVRSSIERAEKELSLLTKQ